jgi:hypothetical protein
MLRSPRRRFSAMASGLATALDPCILLVQICSPLTVNFIFMYMIREYRTYFCKSFYRKRCLELPAGERNSPSDFQQGLSDSSMLRRSEPPFGPWCIKAAGAKSQQRFRTPQTCWGMMPEEGPVRDRSTYAPEAASGVMHGMANSREWASTSLPAVIQFDLVRNNIWWI